MSSPASPREQLVPASPVETPMSQGLSPTQPTQHSGLSPRAADDRLGFQFRLPLEPENDPARADPVAGLLEKVQTCRTAEDFDVVPCRTCTSPHDIGVARRALFESDTQGHSKTLKDGLECL